MKIKKINFDQELEVTIKKVRLPMGPEITYICEHSYLYYRGREAGLGYCFYVQDSDSDEESICYTGGIGHDARTDLIPVIEVEENLEVETVYLTHGIPFVAITEHNLLCLSRTSFGLAGRYGYDCSKHDLDEVANW